MKRTVLLLLAGLLLAPAGGLAQLTPVSQDFEGLLTGDFAGTTDLLRRNPNDFDPPRENTDYPWEVQVASENGDQYLQWNTSPPSGLTTDAHVLIAGSNTATSDYNFDLKFEMRVSRPMTGGPVGTDQGFDQLMQWQFLQGETDPVRRTLQIGRHYNGGAVIVANNASLPLTSVPFMPVGETEEGDPILSDPASYNQWANIRVQKMGNYLRYKIWGEGVDEPAWDSQFASGGVIPDYAGPAVTSPADYLPGSVPEQGIRFKWQAGLAVDDIQLAIPLAGDTDGSGVVDLGDLATLATNWNVTEGMTWLDGDFTGDAAVDLADLAALATNWNQTGDGYPLASALKALGLPAVPEPATLSILSIGALAFFRRRR